MSAERLTIVGGQSLFGIVCNEGSKNAALPIMAASLLTDEPIVLDRVPRVADVETQSRLLERLGVRVRWQGRDRLELSPADASSVEAPHDIVSQMRASICVLGPLVARRRQAIVALPGGCRLGARPIDLHLRGLAALGADIRIQDDHVVATSKGLRGATINLAGRRGPTVTGTANVLMAAVLARGETILQGAAREPEVVDLGELLVSLGARIDGLGSSTLRIRGVEQLGGGHYQLIPDRIEAATLLVAGAIARGDVTVGDCRPDHLDAVLGTLEDAGATIESGRDWVRVVGHDRPKSFQATSLPYPGLPTDVQPLFTALATVADGRSTIVDRVFPERFGHVAGLVQMNASIRRSGSSLQIDGAPQLCGTTVVATDLRAAAGLALAALAADGATTIEQAGHLARGYQQLAAKLEGLGADLPECNTRMTIGASNKTVELRMA